MGVIEVSLKKDIKKFYSANSFGIYDVDIIEVHNAEEGDIVDYGSATIKGYMPELKDNVTYIANITPKNDPKYGLGYEVELIYEKMMSSRDEIETFLKTILTQKQAVSILEVYPDDNVLDLIKSEDFDFSKVHGVGAKTFDIIKQKVIDNEKYQKAIVELSAQFEIPYNAIKKLSDKYGSPEVLIDKLNANPYILTEIDGYGFTKADEIALKMGIEKDSPNRINACILYVLDSQANNGHCWMKVTRLIHESISLLSVKIADMKNVLYNKHDDFEVEDDRVYLKKYKKIELGIKDEIDRLLGEKSSYIIPEMEEKILKIEENQGFSFTDEQKQAIYMSVDSNIIVVNGKAGTGKTATIKGIVGVLKAIKELSYTTCALSGKAAQRIQESTGLDSYTIHRLLKAVKGKGFAYNKECPLSEDIIILDEASMVNSELFYSLIQSVKTGAKLIITGDVAQLEAIGAGNILSDLLKSDEVPKVELTIVHRQAQRSGILSSANLVREGKSFIGIKKTGLTRIGELRDLYLYSYESQKEILNRVLTIASKYNGDIMDFQILAPMKKKGLLCTKELNIELQKIFNRDSVGVEKESKIDRKEYSIIEGDKVILNGNNDDKKVFNGTMGIVSHIDITRKDGNGNNVGEVVIDFEGIGNVSLTLEEAKSIDLAYSISIHKSQGSQWRFVVLALDYASYVLLNRQLGYTGMTRASEALFMIVEMKALEYTIKNDNSSKRRTFLLDLLTEKIY